MSGNKLNTSLFQKETAGNSTLYASSNHPLKLKQNILYGELLRLKRNSTKASDFEIAAKESMARFAVRGYNQSLLDSTLRRVRAIPREQLLKEKIQERGRSLNRRKDAKFRFITAYSAEANFLRCVMKKNWHILRTDSILRENMPSFPLITFRKARSLKDSLVQSHLQIQKKNKGTLRELRGFYPCGKCKACSGSKRVTTYKVPELRGMRTIKKFLTCSTPFAIYCLVCPCGLRYIGSTIHPLKVRILEHQRAIAKKDASYPLARHYAEKHASNRNEISFFGLDSVDECIRGGDRVKRLRRLESRYIIDLQTKNPKGLNSSEELASHLGL